MPHDLICRNCGQKFAEDSRSGCSYHPEPPLFSQPLGARDNCAEIWTFQCCGQNVKIDDGPPPQSPGCTSGPHLVRRPEEAGTAAQSERGYDVFVSFKNLDKEGQQTPDSEMAHRLHDLLSSHHVSVFFSNISLESLGVDAYRRAIDHALDVSSVLVAVGTSSVYLESPWVRYEWDSFFYDIQKGIKPSGKLFAFIRGMRDTELPRVLRQTQVFVDERQEMPRLARFIENALGDGAK